MSGNDIPAWGQRTFLMVTHVTGFMSVIMAIKYKQPLFAITILTSMVISSMMHWCDSSMTYQLEGDAYCFSLTPHMLYVLDRTFAAQAVQTAFLVGPDWDRTKSQSVWYAVSICANYVVALRYGETWILVLCGVVVFVVIQGYRFIQLFR